MGSSSSGELLKKGAKVAASATAAFSLSHLLQQLSGHALWVPGELRVAVEVFTTLLGTTVFLFVDTRRRKAGAAKADAARPVADPEAARHASHSDMAKAISWTLAAIVLFVPYMYLRARCVISWDAREWMRLNAADIQQAKAEGVGVSNAAPGDYVDLEHGQIYIPLFFPEYQQHYFDSLAAMKSNHGMSGVQVVLQTEPDRLIDWIRDEPARMYMWATSVLFLINHLLIIVCVALAAAYAGAKLRDE